MSEKEFIEKIDCKFPYLQIEEARKLIEEAINISSNAVYKVVEELTRVPFSQENNITPSILLDLLKELDKAFEHPLKEDLLSIAEQMILGIAVGQHSVNDLMEKFRAYLGEWNALNVLYFSTDPSENLETKYESIKTTWLNDRT